MILRLLELSRSKKQIIILLLDLLILIPVILSSFSIRLGYIFVPSGILFLLILIAPIIAAPIFMHFGLNKAIIRYIGFETFWSIFKAVTLYALIWSIMLSLLGINGIPRSVILINWIFSLFAISGIRIFARWVFHLQTRISTERHYESNVKRALIYGVADPGIQLISALEYTKDYIPVGFIDDSRALEGGSIRGLEVLPIDDLSNIINSLKVDEVFIVLPFESRQKRLEIINKFEPFPVHVRILPSVADMAQGKININDLREVNIADLLGRDAVEPNPDLLEKNIKNKVVLVTGAGGSIGSELCRQILKQKPTALILFDISESALYSVEKKLSDIAPPNCIFSILGNVNNLSRLRSVMKHYSVSTVYHAAAYKHVPIVEYNNIEGVENNVFGTYNCAKAAIKEKVETFVLISTDKAVRPTNTMGASKRMAELILQAFSKEELFTSFTMVRFGNVLGSSGSVIPLFEKQIKSGGPITVTDKNIHRYFMTTAEAVELVIQAGAMNMGGDVFVLDMGSPILISELAKKMIRLSGLELKDTQNPQGDIEIEYIGLRPGEKLYEELLIGGEPGPTDHPLIFRAKEESFELYKIEMMLKDLKKAIQNNDPSIVRNILINAIPEFKPQSEIVDFLSKKFIQTS